MNDRDFANRMRARRGEAEIFVGVDPARSWWPCKPAGIAADLGVYVASVSRGPRPLPDPFVRRLESILSLFQEEGVPAPDKWGLLANLGMDPWFEWNGAPERRLVLYDLANGVWSWVEAVPPVNLSIHRWGLDRNDRARDTAKYLRAVLVEG